MYQTATKLGQRPSQLTGIVDPWAALQFDNAVVYFGTVIENASQETHKVGDEWKRKYTLAQLLTEGFVLDTDDDEPDTLQGVDGVMFDEVS